MKKEKAAIKEIVAAPLGRMVLAIRQFLFAICCALLPMLLGMYLGDNTSLSSAATFFIAVGAGTVAYFILKKMWPLE